MSLFDFLSFGWLRNLLGIRKDLIDTKKSQLEVEKLEDEKLARKFITTATIDDVKEYDPKYRKIRKRVEIEEKLINEEISELKLFPGDDRPWWLRLFSRFWRQVWLSTLILALAIFIAWIMSFLNE